jgi:hypothetical protein
MAKFLLLAHDDSEAAEWTTGWSPADIRAHLDFHRALEEALIASGELVETVSLSGRSLARRVIGDTVTGWSAGGMIAHYRIVDVAGEARALDIAAQLSAAPGPGGRSLRQPIEVRRIMVPEPSRDT